MPRESEATLPDVDALAEWLDCARDALDRSDALINGYFRQNGAVDNKLDDDVTGASDARDLATRACDPFDPVTEADRGAEQVIRGVLRATFPEHGIVGEEFGASPGTSALSWIIDPIDGTRAFVAGLPTFGTLLGLRSHGTPVFGMMSQPFTGERFWGSGRGSYFQRSGAGARGDALELSVSQVRSLDAALLASTDPNIFPDAGGERAAFDACCARARIVRFGGDCYSYCLLAAGHIDLVIETRLQAYDIAPLIPIILGAGGIVTDWNGAPAHDGGQVIAAATPELHAEVLALLRPARTSA